MTKKILLLVLLLPLILMISLFTTTNTVSLAIDIPVSGIEIISDDIVYLSLDSSETYTIDYTVYPTNATKQEVVFSIEEIEGSRLCKLEYSDNTITPKSVGIGKVTLTTVDGGFKDSFIVQVESNSLQEIESKVEQNKIYVGEKTYITTTFVPNNTANQLLNYVSSDPSVATVDNKGFIQALKKGTVTITVVSVSNPDITSTIELEVLNKDIMDLGDDEITTWNETGTISVSIDTPISYELSYKLYDEVFNPLNDGIMNVTLNKVDNEAATVNYEFLNDFVGKVNVEVIIKTELGLEVKKTCLINRVKEVEVEFSKALKPNYETGVTTVLPFELRPSNADVTYEVVSSDATCVSAQIVAGNLVIQTLKPGIATVTLKVHVNVINVDITDTIDVVVAPKAFTISETAKTYGIENIWTIAKYNLASDGSFVNTTFDLHLSYGKVLGDSNFTSRVSWVSNNPAVKVSTIANEGEILGRIEIVDASFTGIVEIKAVYSYGEYSLESAPFKIRCVGDGVNVHNYEELLKATTSKDAPAVVLHNSIKEDFGYYANGEKMDISDCYSLIPTTYDWTYYKNLSTNPSSVTAPLLKVLIQFKNSVYGNGYTINAHNIAYGLDEADVLKDDAIFRGPLNFVAISDSNSSAVSVKAQDNIIFAAYEGVKIQNVELRGCDLVADGSSYDLTDLTYVGTVLEVLGDGVEVNFSRITNGRMGMRIFGDYKDPNKVITTNISNSIISGAREFLIRMGSNAFVDGVPNASSPVLPNNRINNFPVYTTYKVMSKDEKDAYDRDYIKTFVNVKSSAFRDCGIFSIGIDSHFSGEALADGEVLKKISGYDYFKHWHDLAKTSYGAKLTFDGDVRIYDWKALESVDSSTLIEIIHGSVINKTFDKLTFDVKELVRNLASDERFNKIVYSDPAYKGGTEYVHGGIAFFGGGKNYGVFEYLNEDKSFATLNGYQVSFGDIGRSYLELAAGTEEFYFLMHDSTTLNFLPSNQEEMLSSESAYEFVYKK